MIIRKKQIMLWLSIVAIFFLCIAFAGILFYAYITKDLPTPEEMLSHKVAASTKIFDRTGSVLLYEIHGDEKRTIVPLEDIAPIVQKAVISTEDANFYTHMSFDVKGLMRITLNALTGHGFQGGSTITQQLAKNAFLSGEKTITRKLKELAIGFKLEEQYTKDQILTLYLNQIPYGSNIYGIEEAARTFFNTSAKNLTLAQAAYIAAIPQLPTYYSPWGTHTAELAARKNYVLGRMHELGYITDAEFAAAVAEKVIFAKRSQTYIKAPHFVMYVQEYLTQKYGESFLETEGLEIKTTLDWNLQQIAEKAVADGVKRNTELYGGKNGALVSMDPQTGQILAMVGSADYFDVTNEGNFNVAADGLRQPGSTFKPFAYITAFEKGLTPETLVWDVPTEFSTNHAVCPAIPNFDDKTATCYHPQNFDGLFRGPVMLKNALAESLNIPAVKTLYLAGIDDTIKTAESFGVTTLTDRSRYGLSLVLGGGEVTLLELVNAYGVFATDGFRHSIASILEVKDSNGTVLETFNSPGTQVVDAQYPRLINSILSNANLKAPLFGNSLPLTQVTGHQIALKTGTTNDYVDAWTIGYTPTLVTGVWAGNNHREPLQKKGGSILAAVPMWHDFMSQALFNQPSVLFEKPAAVYVDNPTLRGELVKGSETKDILYQLNRTDDPQYENWQTGVDEWLKTNTFDRSKFDVQEAQSPNVFIESPAAGQGNISITLAGLKNGDFIDKKTDVTAVIKTDAQIQKIEVYINNSLAESLLGPLGAPYPYSFSLLPEQLGLQNSVVLRATDTAGNHSEEKIIVYKNN